VRLHAVFESAQQKSQTDFQLQPLGGDAQAALESAALEVDKLEAVVLTPNHRGGLQAKIPLCGTRPFMRLCTGFHKGWAVTAGNIDLNHGIVLNSAFENAYADNTMIYKFKSKVTGDLIMLQANGESLLKIIGKDQTGSLRQGILQPAEMAQAIAALQQAVALEDQAHADQLAKSLENGETAPRLSTIGLRQRSLPFIQMLQRCLAANEEVVWGV